MFFEEDQVSLFDAVGQSTKMSPEPCRATAERTGKQSSRRSSESQTQTLPQFLCLTKGNGINGEDIWERDLTVGGLLPLGFTMPNGLECRSVGAESVFALTTADGQRTGYCLTLNTGEKPRIPIIKKLRQILERKPHPKYKLSVKACIGILKRALRRGKKLPPALENALNAQAYPKTRQSASKSAQESPAAEKESLSKANEQERSQLSQIKPYATVCIEGNGTRKSHFGDGWRESDQMYTLNTTEQHAVAYGISPYESNAMKSSNPNSGVYKADTSRTLDLNGGSPACNQGGIAIVEPCLNPWDVQSKHVQSEDGIAEALYSGECRYGGGESYVMQEPTVYNGEVTGTVTAVCGGTNTSGPKILTDEYAQKPVGINGDVAGTLDSSYYKGCGEREGIEREVVMSYEPIVLESNQNHATITQDGICSTLPAAMGMGGGYVPMITEQPVYDEGIGVTYLSEQNGNHMAVAVSLDTDPVVYNGECITSPTNAANPQPGDPCHTLTNDTRNYVVQAAGFSFGQSAKARSLGYEEEKSPTIRGSEGGNQKPCVCVYDARGNGNGETVNTLTGDHQDRITDYTAICVESEPVCMATSCVNAEITENGVSPSLLARAGTGGNQLPIISDCTAYAMQAIGEYKESDVASACKMRDYKDATDLVSQVPYGLDRASFNQGTNAQFDFSVLENQQPTLTSRGPGGVSQNAIVRRLTPKECERLQQFPDDWTLIGEPKEVEVKDYEYTYDEDGNETSKTFVGTHKEIEYFYTDENGKEKRLADSVRYKALGNSCALPFWQWLDGRISSEYVGTCTLGSLFDGISAFPLVHARHNGPKSVRWSSEIEDFPIAVSKTHFGDEAIGLNGDIDQFLWR